MRHATFSNLGPSMTPTVIKRLILWTTIITLLSAIFQTLLAEFKVFPGPQEILSLSWWGLENLFVWQLITYLFVQELPFGGITLFYFFSLFFNMYLLWIIGASLLELLGTWPFLRFYFASGVIAGICALLLMPLTGQYAFLAGPTPAIIALLVFWSMAFPETDIFLFFLIPIKAKWLVAIALGALLLMSFSRWDLPDFFLYLAAIFCGYGYATLVKGWHSPFSTTARLDAWLADFGLKLRRYFPYWGKTDKRESKIVDFQTGAPVSDDDAFVDAMLSKISKYGEESLSRSERSRLQRISERKMQNKQ